MPTPARRLLFAALLLGASLVCFRPGPTVLIGGDAGCYARVARELAQRPLAQWGELTLGGQPFFEHPPLGYWVEGAAFRVFGDAVPTAVGVARFWALLSLVLLALGARRLTASVEATPVSPDAAAAFVVLGALAQPGFLYTSQVAMLEMPLTAALALGVACLPLPTKAGGVPWRALAGFALAGALGFWVKGPPVAALWGLVLALAAVKVLRWRDALLAVAGGLVATGALAAAFEGARAAAGLEPFFARYFSRQVVASLTQGRHHPDPNPFFYVRPLLDWYTPGLAAGVAALVLWRRRAVRFLPRLALVGGVLWVGVVLGFTAAVQKYQWYIHPGLVGAALVTGAVLAASPRKAQGALAVVLLVAALAWPFSRLVPWTLSAAEQQLAAIQSAVPPPPGAVVADCSGTEAWVAEHLMAYAWRAQRVACGEKASLTWNGQALEIAPR